MDKIIPAKGYIVVEPYKLPQESGFQLPEIAKEGQKMGKVISFSEEAYTSEYGAIVNVPDIKEGDVIIYKQWGFTEITISMKKYVLVRHLDVAGILKNE